MSVMTPNQTMKNLECTNIAAEMPPNQTIIFSSHSGITFTKAMVPMMVITGIHSHDWKLKPITTTSKEASERATAQNIIPTLGIKRSHLGNKTFPPWEYLISYEYFSIREPYSEITCQYQRIRNYLYVQIQGVV